MCFYADDHPPAHVHCINGDGDVIVEIMSGEVVDMKGKMKTRDMARAIRLVVEHQNYLLPEWNLFDMRRREVR